MTEKPTPISVALSKAWPSLRYLSLGVWSAWLFMISSGIIWLSDTEFDGSPVAMLMLAMSIIGAVLCLAAPLARKRVENLLAKRSLIVAAALIATVGALAIIAAGPYYLYNVPLFWVGVVLVSLFSSVFALKCGSLFGKLDSKRVLLFCLYSEIFVVALSYFIIGNDFFAPVSGGPSLAGILAFALLPLLAAWLVCLPSSGLSNGNSQNVESHKASDKENDTDSSEESDKASGKKLSIASDEDIQTNGEISESFASETPLEKLFEESASHQDPLEKTTTRGLRYPSDFWKLLFMIFFFTLVSEMFRNYFVFVRMPEITFLDSKLVLLLRLGFALVLLFYAIRTHRKIRFSAMYLYSLVTLAVVVALIPLLMDHSTLLGSLIGGVSACMVLFIWCLLSMVVSEKNMSFVVVFGFGWGMLLFARACGWLLGMHVLPVLMDTSWESIVYWGVAILILVAAILLFSETRLDKLFGNVAESQISLDISQPAAESEKERRPWHEAALRVGERAALSQREMEIFELIATGRTPANIAKHFVVSVNTVRTHIRNIYTKTGAHSREELVEMIEEEIKTLEE